MTDLRSQLQIVHGNGDVLLHRTITPGNIVRSTAYPFLGKWSRCERRSPLR